MFLVLSKRMRRYKGDFSSDRRSHYYRIVSTYMRLWIVAALLTLCASAAAQSGRVGPATNQATADPANSRSVKGLFDEANAYNRVKFAEFEQKKIPVSDALIQQTLRERKQLAARYAATVGKRTDLSADEIYYLGMLHWVADNADGARETFLSYLTKDNIPPEKAQDARAIVALIYARQRQFDASEKMLAEYLKGSPVRPNQRAQIEREIARGLAEKGDLAATVAHAETAYSVYRSIASDPAQKDKTIDVLIESGFFLFKT